MVLVNEGSFSEALEAGWNNAKVGLTTGAASGFHSGMQRAKAEKVNPWSGKSKLPTQTHHFATDKNAKYTLEMQDIAAKYDLDLNGDWNKAAMPHQGRHPNAYHEWVLDNMKMIDKMPGMNQQNFIKYFNLKIKQPVLNNPQMLRKNYWK
jgi:hypothetical protein